MENKKRLRIGTRASKLAIAQSEWVKTKILNEHPGIQVDLVRISTKGDKIIDSPLSSLGGKGLFVKEIEEALLNKQVDLAVHSVKDVPAEMSEGLLIQAFPKREDPSDAFISSKYKTMEDLPKNASIGTGSLRRSVQLKCIRPDLSIVPIRGNVDTRLKKMDSGDVDAIILAAAGLIRLGLSNRINSVLNHDDFIPAVGQGILGLETRDDDSETMDIIGFLNHKPTELVIRAERAFLKKLEGGCQIPLAAYGIIEKDKIRLKGMVAELDGNRIVRDEIIGDMNNPEDIGIILAEHLLESGAGEILERIHKIINNENR